MIDKNKELYINRELSWLEFNDRVLDEAYDKSSKILTRFKFLAIAASNLDEFFMVRVAGLKQQEQLNYNKKDISGRTPTEQLGIIGIKTQQMMGKIYSCYNRSLLPKLKDERITIKHYEELSQENKRQADDFFEEICFPVLTPLAIDAGRPFPLLQTKSINIGVRFSAEDESDLFAVVQVPAVLPRLIDLGHEGDEKVFLWLESLIINKLNHLFDGYQVEGSLAFRITRDADLDIEEDEAQDLLLAIEENIRRRKWGETVRLEIQYHGDKKIRKFLKRKLEIDDDAIYQLNGPLDMTCWFEFIQKKSLNDLVDPLPTPQEAIDFFGYRDFFAAIQDKDRLLHHPYESFDPVLDFIEQAVNDPQVLAIKQTLYRVGNQSPLIDQLIRAVEKGKQVTVVVELKARFDEERNIGWARKLERSGCHVVYGLPGLKIHSKALLIVRKESQGIRRYVHLSTGNYNETTATLYEDIGMFTCREDICMDVSNMFNAITGYTRKKDYRKIFVAPEGLRSGFEYFIRREIRHKEQGKKGKIIVKINSLIDKGMIDLLYHASQKGVEIELIVRGICGLKAGVVGLSEKITVRSIVGTFLEHSRIYYFYNDGEENYYLSSADWMERNLDRRVEIMFPIEDKDLKDRIGYFFETLLADTEKSRIQQPDGTYRQVDGRGKTMVDSQLMMHAHLSQQLKNKKKELMQL